MMKEKKGITLIALVITIIVLLILAGVSISAISGENGIVTKAKQAKEETEKAGKKEEEDLQAALDYIDSNVNDTDVLGNDWIMAWTCTNGTWSELFEPGSDVEGQIVAKIYETGKKIVPHSLNVYGTEFNFEEGNELVLVIEGNGEMGSVITRNGTGLEYLTGGFAWQTYTLQYLNGEIDYCIVPYITELIVRDGITNLGEFVCGGASSLNKITIGKDVTHIDEAAFAWCDSITKITIPDNVLYLGERIFAACRNLEKVVIPESITVIPCDTFWSCTALKEVVLPNTLRTIESYAFADCLELENITIPSLVSEIEVQAFANSTKLSKVKILNTMVDLSVSTYVFDEMAQNSVIYVLNENVKTKLEGKYDSSKTTVQVVTEEEMNNL